MDRIIRWAIRKDDPAVVIRWHESGRVSQMGSCKTSEGFESVKLLPDLPNDTPFNPDEYAFWGENETKDGES